MTWRQGHATIVLLINRGHLEQIGGIAANGQYLIEQARRRLSSARAILHTDPVSAYTLAYDAARQACVSTLLQQGLRPLTAPVAILRSRKRSKPNSANRSSSSTQCAAPQQT